MSEDRRVTRRSNKECREIALREKVFYGTQRRRPVNIGKILNSGKILTIFGERKLIYEVVEDSILGKVDGKTEMVDGAINITAKRSVDQQADWGVGRARMTLAHELGHGVMHATDGITDNRLTGAGGTTAISQNRASESAEHQAKVFASAFLIDDEVALTLDSAEAISTEFLVSFEAAEICFERLQEQVERAASAARVMKLNKEFQDSMREDSNKLKYLDVLCVSCTEATLVPIGVKVLCSTCGYVGDHPQNGDPA